MNVHLFTLCERGCRSMAAIRRVIAVLLLAAGSIVHAITPAELQKQLEVGASLILVDIRSTSLFQEEHIAGAINVPAALVSQKELPPLGKVVVYDSGLGKDEASGAVLQLNQKPGIQAETLEGGMAGWKTVGGKTSGKPGLHKEAIAVMTYAEVKTARPSQMVIVDLREGKRARQSESSSVSQVDLAAEFPGVAITRSPSLPRQRQSASDGGYVPPLMVLIDNGDGKAAHEAARKLRAQGYERVVVLAGGEEIVARKGRAGLQREGLGNAGSDISKPE